MKTPKKISCGMCPTDTIHVYPPAGAAGQKVFVEISERGQDATVALTPENAQKLIKRIKKALKT